MMDIKRDDDAYMLTRGQVLRRALVGGALITFGKLPEQVEKVFGPQPAAAARTAIPTSARLVPVGFIPGERSEGESLFLTDFAPRESGEWVTRESWQRVNNIVLLTAQKAEWLEPIEGHPPVIGGEFVDAVMPPNSTRFYQVDDILRAAHNGDCYRVRAVMNHDSLSLEHVGHTAVDCPLIDARAESAELAKLLPPR